MVLRLILRQDKKENTEITRKNICLNLWKKVSYIKNNNCAYVYVNCLRHLYECLVTCLRKSSSKTGVELLVFLTFIISFMKAFIQEHNLLPGCAFGLFTCLCCENCMSWFSAYLFLTCFVRSLPNGNFLSGA